MRSINKPAGFSGMHLIAGLSLVIGLAACGGGGGGGGGGGIVLPTAPVTITDANAPQVAGAAIDTLYGGTSLPIGVQTSASATSVASTAQTIAKIGQMAAQQIVAQGAAPAIVTGVSTTPTSCQSGTMTQNQTSSTSGSVTFSNCVDIAGVTINGTVSISNINSINPISMDIVFNLAVTTALPANTLTAMGDMHFVMDTSTLAMTMSGTSLAMGNTNPAMGNFGLQNYSIAIDLTGVTAMSFTFASTAIDGTAFFEMITPFVYGSGMFPSSGEAIITGANPTVLLRLTVLGNEFAAVGSQVKLDLSTDSGGTWGTPTYPDWADISSVI